ncbi:glycosyltransferase [Kluyvera sp. CRP]|uniref:glycosyltransferase n=1 Tax=Kluyvera sp. CRP TaxID=2873269 RepID=UPI00211241BB|nr:glycosyltransferase [Kluyvera sp. CRP]
MYRNIFKHIECKFVFEHDSDRNKILNLLHLNRSKTVVIDGAGIDIDFFSFSEEPSREKVKVLFASRLLWSKGLSDLIAVKQKLHDSGTSFELLVAGIIVDDDKDAISLKQINIWNDKGDITWLGTRDDINELIKLSNVIVLPSIYAEGIPRILLEAGAVGRAVITYNIGGCNSLIKNGINGFVVEKKNIEQLSVKLEELIADKNLRARLGRNARRIIEAKYSSEIIIKKTLRVYGEFS